MSSGAAWFTGEFKWCIDHVNGDEIGGHRIAVTVGYFGPEGVGGRCACDFDLIIIADDSARVTECTLIPGIGIWFCTAVRLNLEFHRCGGVVGDDCLVEGTVNDG